MSRCVVLFVILAALGAMNACQRPDVAIEETPLKVITDEPGRGRPAFPGEVVRINYTAYLPDGTRVLSHDDYRFELGAGSVIQGIDEAVQGMRAGGRRTFMCPPHKHWGRAGYGTIPANTPLRFDLYLAEVEN